MKTTRSPILKALNARMLLLICPGLLTLLAISCVSDNHMAPATPSEPIVWPALPDAPRIAFVRAISGPADIGSHPSVWHRVAGFITGETAPADSLVKPFGVATDEFGNLCLTDTANTLVYYCDLKRKQWRHWDGVGKTKFTSPVAVVHRNGLFYVADSELSKVFAFDENGRGTLIIAAPLQRPAGLTIVSNSLFVVDSQLHAVLVFDLRGQLQFRFGQRGTGKGEFNFPTHIGCDPAGHVLVTDSLNSRVQVFDSAGQFLSQIGSAGDAPGSFGRPKGVAADSFGHIYVADAMFDNLQIFDLSGQLLLNLGGGGTKPGQFGVPAGIAITADNQIYVADSYNHRVQVFKYVGTP